MLGIVGVTVQGRAFFFWRESLGIMVVELGSCCKLLSLVSLVSAVTCFSLVAVV